MEFEWWSSYVCGVLSYFANNDFYHKCGKGTWSLGFGDESKEQIKQWPDTCLGKADILRVGQTKSWCLNS